MRTCKPLFALIAVAVCMSGCGKSHSAFDDVDMSKVITSSENGASTASQSGPTNSGGQAYDTYRQSLDENMQGVVAMDDLDSTLQSDASAYTTYDLGSDQGIERDADGSIAFHIGDVSFIYRQDIDIQLVTSEDSNVIYVKGLDSAKSSMSIGVYSGEDYADQFETIKAEDHLHYDINGNPYWSGQSVDNKTWYYAYQDVLEPCVVIVTTDGNFRQRYLDICLPVPERYDVERYDTSYEEEVPEE